MVTALASWLARGTAHRGTAQGDRRWEVWGPVTKGTGLYLSGNINFSVDGTKTSFYSSSTMSYPQLIVYAL